jgi:hypothetical protein
MNMFALVRGTMDWYDWVLTAFLVIGAVLIARRIIKGKKKK